MRHVVDVMVQQPQLIEVYMKNVTKEMIKIYQPISNLDWLNYKITKKCDLTYHHIVKREDGGKEVIENGALLMPVALAHQYLHLIECLDLETYIALNNLFKVINKQGYEPIEEQRAMIEYLLKEFENVHRWDKGSKGKLMIKRKYLERSL